MNWRRRAACRGMVTDLFFPESSDHSSIAEARAVCAACPVSNECLLDSIQRPEPAGIFGGTTVRQRRAIRRMFGIGASVETAKHGTDSTYGHYRCRCDACTTAHRVAARERYWRQRFVA